MKLDPIQQSKSEQIKPIKMKAFRVHFKTGNDEIRQPTE
jgi:hypothetical protein